MVAVETFELIPTNEISSDPNNTNYINMTEVRDMAKGSGSLVFYEYDPNAPVPYWHQHLALAFIIIFDVSTLMIIIARTYFRRIKMHSFRWDDGWMMAAGVIMLAYFPVQVINILSGIGLYWENVKPENYHLLFGTNNVWAGYYLICTFVKISMCCCHLHILPAHMVIYRRHVLGLCVFIMAVGLMETFVWLFACYPAITNFVWNAEATSCLSLDPFRYTWVAVSCAIDICILSIPFVIVRNAHLPPHKKRVLRWVFAANLLGTVTCAASVYGVWYDRKANNTDSTWTEVPYILLNNLEVLMYTLGASLPVASPYLIAQSEARSSSKRNSNSGGNGANDRFSWRRVSKSNGFRGAPSLHYADINRVVTIGGTEPLDAAALDREFGAGIYRINSKSSKSSGSRRDSKYGGGGVVTVESLQKPAAVLASDTVNSGSTKGSGARLLRNTGEDRIQGWTFAMIDEEEGAGMYDGPGWRDTVERLEAQENEKGHHHELKA